MLYIKIAGAALNQTPLDWKNNKRNIIYAIETAKKQKVSLLCLPELCITGYGCEDFFFSQGLQKNALQILKEILPYTKKVAVCLGLPLSYQNRIFNTVCLVVNGKIIGFVAKQFLANNGIYYESRWFTPWKTGSYTCIDIEGENFPIGDIYFNLNGVKVGFEICEDAWSANRTGRNLAALGVDIILNPSASHFAFEKVETRKHYILEGSRAFGVSYVYVNLLGNDSGRIIFDGGTIIASYGKLVAIGERLTFHDTLLTTAIIDVNKTRLIQAQNAKTIVSISNISTQCIDIHFVFPNIFPKKKHLNTLNWEMSKYLKEEEFTRVLALGLFDYMRKSYSKGFVISLSGGVDSSATTCCCYLMIKLAIENIGIKKFKQKLNYFKSIQSYQTIEDFAKEMIMTAYQSTENSGKITRCAAANLAKVLHTQHLELPVNNIFKDYVNIISKSLDITLDWKSNDVALQNIQSRVRSPGIWLLANIKGSLLLSTSNRSEAALGYTTMDGDTSGGLSPIAGIDKKFLRKWLVWLETKGLEGNFTIPVLKIVNDQEPTAELRPQDCKQTDEEDLMPYEILENIEELAIGNKKMPLECYSLLKVNYGQYKDEQLKTWVVKFFKLWSSNQWKRERYAPSFHLDDKNLDPKTWCRFPILSGNFEKELEDLNNN